MSTFGRVKLLICILVGPLLLAGCRAEEQGRLLRHEPGVYKGAPDQPLGQDVLRELEHRLAGQGQL